MKKNLFFTLSFALFGLMIITTTSCGDDNGCNDADCANGSCFEDACVCDVGYAQDAATGFCTECATGYVKDTDGNCVEECDDANCGPNEECVGNVCDCKIGYERDANNDCVLERNKFLGLYTSEDICGTDTFRYDVVIDELVGTDDGIRLENLGGFDCQDPNTGDPVDYHVEATTFGASLSFTDFETCNTVFTGSGDIVTETITIIYSATYNGQTDNCTATLTLK